MEYFLLGLGNPSEYRGTRHNIGKDIVEGLVLQGGDVWKKVGKGRIACTKLGAHTITCAVTDGFMNETGKDMRDILREIHPERLLLIHDDIDFDTGVVHLSRGKSPGGHRGVSSVIDEIGTKEFPRIRIGVGKGKNLKKYVLDPVPEDEVHTIADGLRQSLPSIFQRLFSKKN